MDKKNKNIVLLILSIFPLKVLVHYFLYPMLMIRSGRYNIREGRTAEYESLGLHFDSIFVEELRLFIPAIIIVLFIGWYFGLFNIFIYNKKTESNNKVQKTEISKNSQTPIKGIKKAEKETTDNLEQFKKAINLFINEMKKMPDWYQIIQERGNGHAMFAKTMNIKVDDYEYWANAHKEEYMLKYNDGNLDVEGINLRIEKFGFIVAELEKVIKKAAELNLNITHEMHNDYCAARASVLGAEYALKDLFKNNNKQSYPAWFNGEKLEKGSTVKNNNTSESINLNNVEFSIYKLIIELKSDFRKTNFFMGGSPEFTEKVEKGIQWFEENNLEAYNILFRPKKKEDVELENISSEEIPDTNEQEDDDDDDEGGVVLYEVVEHRYTYNYYGDENLEDIEVVAFNIDELIFENEDERNDFYENGEGESDRDSEEGIVFYNGNRNNETFDKLSKLIEENDDYEQGDGDWRSGNVFKSYKGANKHRSEKYLIPFEKSKLKN